MEKINIFNYDNFQSFLKSRIDTSLHSKTGIKNGSLDRLALKLGYKSPSSLSMILKGDRLPSENLITQLMDYWNLGASEREYLRTLVQLEKSRRKGSDTSSAIAKLKKLNKKKTSFHFSSEEFEHIKDWHMLVIKELAYTSDFQEDPIWISRRLRRKVTPSQAKHALNTLEKLGVLYRDDSGVLKPRPGFTESTHEVPSAAIRQHHRGMIRRAEEALEEQTVEQRQFNSLTLRVDPVKLPEMKAAILRFAKEFHSEFESESANSIYQLSLQFFEHTQAVSAKRNNNHESDFIDERKAHEHLQ